MLLQTLLLLSACSALLPLATGWKKRAAHLLRYYVLAGCCYDMIMMQTCFSPHTDQLIGNLYLPTEFTLLALYYKKEVFCMKASFPFISVGTLLLYLVHTTWGNGGWFYFNYTGTALFNLYYSVVSLAGFLMLIREQKNSFVEKSAFFWTNTAIIMYASGNLFIFLLWNNIELADPDAILEIRKHIFYALNILKNILLGIAFTRRQNA